MDLKTHIASWSIRNEIKIIHISTATYCLQPQNNELKLWKNCIYHPY